jgi:16S rRNA (cytidine1402-2'-O)-methyltransferase
MSTLYVVATPIGNLEDITFRAIRVLGEVSVIAAEDTRTTRKLLTRYAIKASLVSYYDGNRDMRIPYLLKRLEDSDVALVSEAGVPVIRDPGQHLVDAAAKAGHAVVTIPGPSAVTAALAVAGMAAGEFLFLGFLPNRREERRRKLEEVSDELRTLVVFEAPHRLRASLADMVGALGAQRPVVVCRELTKMYEEVHRGTLDNALAHFAIPRGEFTLVIAGAPENAEAEQLDMDEVLDDLRRLKSAGAPAKEAMAWMGRHYGLSRRKVYQMWLSLNSS